MSLDYSRSVKLLTEHHLELLCLKGGCTGSSSPTLAKMPHCCKPNVVALIEYDQEHNGKCIRRFAGIYAYCRYFIDRKW